MRINMKRFLQLIWFVAVLGCAFVNADTGGVNSESSSSEESNCPEKSDVLIKKAISCLAPNSTLSRDINSIVPEEIRFFIKSYCYNRRPVRQCLQEVIDESRQCFTIEKRRSFELLEDFLEVALDVACSHYGEKLARIAIDLLTIKQNQTSSQRLEAVTLKCQQASGLGTNTDPSMEFGKRLFHAYKSIKSFKECFVADARDFVRTTMDIDELLTSFLDKMKCLDTSSDAFILCKELDRYCPMTGGYTTADFLGRGFECFETNFTRHHRLDVTIDKARALVKEYCDTQEQVRHCIHEMASDADQCFNDTDIREAFKVIKRDLELALDVGCSNNGKKMASLFRELRSLTKNVAEDQKILDQIENCKRVPDGVEVLGTNVSLSHQIFLGYKTVQDIRGCIVDNLIDKLTSINELADLSREYLERMDCLHPDNSVEKCRNLNEEGTGNRTCQGIEYYNDTKQLRQHFFDRGFGCISVQGIRFEHLRNDSSPDELRAFVNDYCRGLPRVGDCLSDVAFQAELCLGPPPHRIFKVLKQMMETALETGCTQDADRLVTVFGGLQMHGGASGEVTEAQYECIDMSVLKLKLVPQHGDNDAMRVYRETESFQECLVNEIVDPGVRNLTEIFLTDVMKELNCQQHFEGHTALCSAVRIDKPQEDEENVL